MQLVSHIVTLNNIFHNDLDHYTCLMFRLYVPFNFALLIMFTASHIAPGTDLSND